jgi:hypothetical protein
MKQLLFLYLFGLLALPAFAQPEIAQKLRDRYEIKNGFKAVVKIQIDVPGIKAPVKTIEVTSAKGDDLKIKGEGLILMPKKGFIEQFSELLNAQVEWIHMKDVGEEQFYKLVSLEAESEWVTADLRINTTDPRIEEINLTTRESGVFQIHYLYEKGKYPVRTEISFVTEKFSIPLKFMGKSDGSELTNTKGKVSGKITLNIISFEEFE